MKVSFYLSSEILGKHNSIDFEAELTTASEVFDFVDPVILMRDQLESRLGVAVKVEEEEIV